jgi:hypothetical protein
MSSYRSDKCTQEELDIFKLEVMNWLRERFDLSEVRMRAFKSYNGDIRIYTGYMEFQNSRSSFRRTEEVRDENGNITGWKGTRGKHTTKIAEYISINRDEFDEIKKAYENKDPFWEDYLFSKLPVKN